MGLFDFLSINNNKTSDNGLNEIYYDDGKSNQIQEKYYQKDGKIDGIYESYYENGKISIKAEFTNGIQNGLSSSYNINGILIRKSQIIKNNEIIGITKEFYSNSNIRLEIDNNENKYTVYRKDGSKNFEAYFKFKQSEMRVRGGPPSPRYSNRIWRGKDGWGNYFPFGEWVFYNIEGNPEYILDFKLQEKFTNSIEFVIKKNINQSGEVSSLETLDIISFHPEYLSNYSNDITKRKIELYDIEPNLVGQIFSIQPLTIDPEKLKFFSRSTKNPLIFGFTYLSCGYKLMFETMQLEGGIDSFVQIKSEVDENNNLINEEWESKSINLSLYDLDYVKNQKEEELRTKYGVKEKRSYTQGPDSISINRILLIISKI